LERDRPVDVEREDRDRCRPAAALDLDLEHDHGFLGMAIRRSDSKRRAARAGSSSWLLGAMDLAAP
jgi:hypothetical protein